VRGDEAVYGVGGGITWGSDADAEHAELLAKARVLTRRTRPAGLIETFAAVDGRPHHLDDHLQRLLGSAAHFDIPADDAALRAAVTDAVAGRDGAARVRLRLDVTGTVDVTVSPLSVPEQPVRLGVDDRALDLPPIWRCHKTVHREPYDRARARHPGVDDVVLRGERGELTETTVATLAVCLDGVWCTPPVRDGALPGVARARLVADGTLRERTLCVEDLARADAVAVVSSLRGWRAAVLVASCPSVA
jgi:para-aminobenzoate synthetase/4-amino-4-deoxychorismate lyase